ncbi:Cu/Zn superoxide dismutase [Melampsora americana]|nr:Cu/Zn superoxide dismutase [Melampsora americana]
MLKFTYVFGHLILTFPHLASAMPQFNFQSISNGVPVARARVLSPPNSIGRIGVRLTVNGLDTVQPIMQHKYHIHAHPIGRDGDCAAALGHLSPNGLPDSTPCDPLIPGRCQEGDLGGKHGLLPGNERTVTRQYIDTSLRLQPERESILGRSVVIHGQDNSRIACGNIVSSLDGTA